LLHQRGHLAEAASLYLKILAQNPTHADALHLLGVIELQRGNLTAALEGIDRAIALDPTKAAYFSNRGVVLQDLKRFDEALATYDRALALRPDNPEVLNNRGTSLRELKRFDEAFASYERALAVRPAYAEALNNRGNVLRDMKRLDEALASYERALALRQDYVDACSNRAGVLKELGRHDEARAASEKVVALKPDHAQAHNTLGNILAEQGRVEDAIARYERALVLKPDYVEAHMNLADVLKSRGSFDLALEHYRKAAEIMPSYADAHLKLGDLLVEQGRHDEALMAAERAAALEGQPAFPHFQLGMLLARCGRRDEARRHLLEYLHQDPSDSRGARLILSGLGDTVPERASETHLRGLYASRAARWGGTENTYRGHELVAAAVESLRTGNAKLDILDAGCGTGLAGMRLRMVARRLDGVDLSPEMLHGASQSGAYDRLHEGDLVKFLSEHAAAYDVIVSAATLIHFGELKPVFQAAAGCLRAGGLLVFTLFPNEADERELAPAPLGGLAEGGCYVHHPDYVMRRAGDTGFSVVSMAREVHEHDDRGRPVHALVVALRRDDVGARSPLQKSGLVA
jgi:predicted TPR repeat methyltransferase